MYQLQVRVYQGECQGWEHPEVLLSHIYVFLH